jgi:hypothetical protein
VKIPVILAIIAIGIFAKAVLDLLKVLRAKVSPLTGYLPGSRPSVWKRARKRISIVNGTNIIVAD